MNPDDVCFYRDRWKAVEEIERQELRASTPQGNWKKMNALYLFAKENGLLRGRKIDDEKMEIYRRWAMIKEKYEQSQNDKNE